MIVLISLLVRMPPGAAKLLLFESTVKRARFVQPMNAKSWISVTVAVIFMLDI